jgi:A/G-specific adenine glycosylase
MSALAELLIDWQKKHGRHHLPWQGSTNPYAVWLSEIMLQQTQVSTVIPYYLRFIRRFPTIDKLAQGPLDDVLALWSGLGYYTRARNLHRAALLIMTVHQGIFPRTREEIQQLPGIGRSTAAAVAVFAFGQRDAILDGNVKRVFARYFGVAGYPGETETLAKLWRLAEQSLPGDNDPAGIRAYTQGLMDLGALLCIRRNPFCERCPLQHTCVAYQEKRVALLPVPRFKKRLPEKQTVFMIYRTKQKLLLEKRPDQGIWGGLWCFPENTVDRGRLKAGSGAPGVELPQLMHTFTHYRLWIHPQMVEVKSEMVSAGKVTVWVAPEEALNMAIPTPVRKLIVQHFLNDLN